MIKPAPSVLELPLLDRAQLAMDAAVERVIEKHARKGLPLYIGRDGKVVAVPAKELQKSRNGKRKKSKASPRQSR